MTVTGCPTRIQKRIDPAQRKALLLQAAQQVLQREGLGSFSLEAVAREARVAATLPRYYFGSTTGLLKASTAQLLQQVELILMGRDPSATLSSRYTAYLQVLRKHPWGHDVWMRAAYLHVDFDAMISGARVRFSEILYRKPWEDLSYAEKIQALGRIGYIEAVVQTWIALGMVNTEETVDALVKISTVTA